MWNPPPRGVFKVNVDAATNSQEKKVGLAAVITNSKGKIIAAGINQSHLKEDINIAEAEAVEWGLQVARKLALPCLIIESDCKEVVELVNNTEGSRIAIHWIISEVQYLFRNLHSVNVKFVPRDCNTHAHSLAKFALEKDTSAV